jgi:hypothetical protein
MKRHRKRCTFPQDTLDSLSLIAIESAHAEAAARYPTGDLKRQLWVLRLFHASHTITYRTDYEGTVAVRTLL